MGLQYKCVEELSEDLNLQPNILLPNFYKAMRKFTKLFRDAYEKEIEAEMAKEGGGTEREGIKQSLAEELGGDDGNAMISKMKIEKEEFMKKFKLKRKGEAGLEKSEGKSSQKKRVKH